MSWEAVTLLCIIVLCGTHLIGSRIELDKFVEKRMHEKLGELIRFNTNINGRVANLESLKLSELVTRVKVLEENQITMLKVVDEAKKLLSQQNMAQSVGGIRLR